MSDQNDVSDWRAYFDALGPGKRSANWTPVSPMYDGAIAPTIAIMKDAARGDLEIINVDDGENLFDRAKEVYEANEGPEMWVSGWTGSPPWHAPALPKVKKRNK